MSHRDALHRPGPAGLVLPVLALLALAPPAVASGPGTGAIRGVVAFPPEVSVPEPRSVANTTDPQVCGKVMPLGELVVSEDRGLAHAVVALSGVPEEAIPARRPGEAVLDNRDCRFHPRALVLRAGAIAAYLYEHGDSGCGDANWPKTFIYVAGWGYGHATLDGEPLYRDYQMHFMVTKGIRRRDTLKVDYPLLNKDWAAGAVNPATQQLDFYIRSPETDERNNPPRKVFDHFFSMEVTWR